MARLAYELTEDDLIAAGRAHHRNAVLGAFGGYYAVVKVACVMFVIVLAVAAFFDDERPLGRLVLPALLVFPLIYAVTYYVQIPRSAKAVLAQQKQLKGLIEADWTDERVDWRAANWNSSIAWGDYHAFNEGEGFTQLYQTGVQYQIVPDRAFADPQARAEMIRLLEAAGVERVNARKPRPEPSLGA